MLHISKGFLKYLGFDVPFLVLIFNFFFEDNSLNVLCFQGQQAVQEWMWKNKPTAGFLIFPFLLLILMFVLSFLEKPGYWLLTSFIFDLYLRG